VRDTKAAEIGQFQSPNRRCDFMELMLTPDQLSKADYPSVIEGAIVKSTETNPLEDLMGGSNQDGPKSGPVEGKLDNTSLEDGLGVELDP
jgi:hypothetical protein